MTPNLRPLAALATGLALSLPLAAMADSPPRTITVSGNGSINTAPDMATITIGVREDADSAREAMDLLTAGLGPVLDELASAGIAATNIQTSGLSLGARYIYPDNHEPKLVGYTASSSVEVRLHDLSRVGTVLDMAVSEGANQLSGISFGLADPSAARDAARRAAVEDALARAGLYAESAGVTLGDVLSISESGGSFPMPVAEAMRDSAEVPVAAGEIEVSASVTMVFAME